MFSSGSTAASTLPDFKRREHLIEPLVRDGLGLQPQKLADGLLAEGSQLALESDFRRLSLLTISPPNGARPAEGAPARSSTRSTLCVDQVRNGLGVVIKGGCGRREDGAHFGKGGHGAQVADVQRAIRGP